MLATQREGNRRLTETLRPVRISASQAEILGVLAGAGPMSLSALGRRIVCESGSPSRTVDLLVRRGLVNRVQSTKDRRYVDLEITPAGSDLLPMIIEGVNRLDQGIAASLQPQERAELNRLLTRLLGDAEALAAIDLRCGPLGAVAAD